jgi:toxin ParE1/3/4
MYVRWSRRADRQLDEISDYLLERNVEAAKRTYRAIWDQAQRLADYPELGRPGRIPDTRELVIASTPYILLYSVEPDTDTIEIRGVYHGAQRWPDAP